MPRCDKEILGLGRIQLRREEAQCAVDWRPLRGAHGQGHLEQLAHQPSRRRRRDAKTADPLDGEALRPKERHRTGEVSLIGFGVSQRDLAHAAAHVTKAHATSGPRTDRDAHVLLEFADALTKPVIGVSFES